jgi:hypothetical protein
MDQETLDRLKLARIIRERLDRENDLMAHRTTWTVASQSFLLSAYAGCVAGASHEPTNPHAKTLEALVILLPWTAVASLIVLVVAVSGGLLTMAELRGKFQPNSAHEHLMMRGPFLPRMAGLIAPVAVPFVFLLTWAAVLSFR